jgi:hypothetical protein
MGKRERDYLQHNKYMAKVIREYRGMNIKWFNDLVIKNNTSLDNINKGIWAVDNTDNQITEDSEPLPPLSKLTEVFLNDNKNKTT